MEIMEKINYRFRYYWDFIKFMLTVYLFVFCLALCIQWLKDKAMAESLENKWEASLFLPHCGDFTVETIIVEEKDGDIVTVKKNLESVTYAQLRFYPTIGCAKPTLFYLTADSRQINQMSVDEAKIINE